MSAHTYSTAGSVTNVRCHIAGGGQATADFIIEIDIGALVKAIGGKAVRSKAKVTKMQNGAVIVRAVNVRMEV